MKKHGFVLVDGIKISVKKVKFLDIEEGFNGADIMTFEYDGKTHKSYIYGSWLLIKTQPRLPTMNNTTTEKRLYKSTITLEIFSKERVNNLELGEIMDGVHNSEFLLKELTFSDVQLSEKESSEALKQLDFPDFLDWIDKIFVL